MTDQADTPDPIGRADLWALALVETRALRAENERLTEQRDAMIWAAEQLQSERDSALAELAAARDREAAAGEPIRGRVGMDVRAVLRGRLIDYDSDGIWTLETDGADHVPWRINLHWAQPFLAALSQSEPTKETP